MTALVRRARNGWRRLTSRLLSQSGRMRRDWDRRAGENAKFFIACGTSESDEAFWASGENELSTVILHGVELEPRASALEIGCGMGRLLRPLSRRAARVVGVDISPEMVERTVAALRDLPNVEVFVTSGKLDRVATASIDFVFSFIVFQHIPSRKAIVAYVAEASRVLKGGGVFKFQVDGRRRSATTDLDTWLGAWFTPGEIRDVLQSHGFSIVDHWGEDTQYYWLTAVRDADGDKGAQAAARARSTAWNVPSLERLIRRFGLEPGAHLDDVMSGKQSVRSLADDFLASADPMEPSSFVRRAYEVVFDRPADEAGLAFYTGEIHSGLPRSYIMDCLVAAPELRDLVRVPASMD